MSCLGKERVAEPRSSGSEIVDAVGMCGIAAIYDPGARTAPRTLSDLVQALRHRGPDGQASWCRGPAALVHTRLAIIDVADGDQPFTSEDGGTTAIVNGEIYNHLTLRAELQARGHRFASHSDCEVVLHGYEEWGMEVFGRLNGMFGLAIWDDQRRPAGARPRCLRRQAGLLVDRRSACGRRLGGPCDPRHGVHAGRARSGRTRPLLDLAVRPRAEDDVRRHRKTRPGHRADRVRERNRDPQLPLASRRTADRDRPARAAPGGPHRIRARGRPPDDVRRSVRRVPERRSRLGRGGGRDGEGGSGARSAELHDRVPGSRRRTRRTGCSGGHR